MSLAANVHPPTTTLQRQIFLLCSPPPPFFQHQTLSLMSEAGGRYRNDSSFDLCLVTEQIVVALRDTKGRRRTSNDVEGRRRTSKDVEECQTMLKDVKRCQTMSNDVSVSR